MSHLRVAINGVGRIGGAVAKLLLLGDHPELTLVALNDHGTAQDLQDYLQLDSVYGRFPLPIRRNGKKLIAGSATIETFMQDEPIKLPWRRLRVDVVVEATGAFTSEKKARAHLAAGAKQVIITTAPHGGSDNYSVFGTDHSDVTSPVLTHGSCTTTAITPVLSMIQNRFTVKAWTLFGVQSVTHSQEIVDKSHGANRRRRQALNNIIPVVPDTDRAIPDMFSGSLANYAGQAVRVPTSIVHLAVLTLHLKQTTSAQELNAALKQVSRQHPWRGIVRVSDEPLVSQDLRQTSQSAIIDAGMTKVAGSSLAQLGVWYDNEWAFAHRMVELLRKIASSAPQEARTAKS